MSVGSVSNALSGLSGYDFSGIVDSLVSVYKIPESAMVASQAKVQTTSDAWKDVNTRMAALEATLTGLSDSSTWTSTKASTSNSSIVSATTGISAVKGSYDIHVDNIAKTQTVASASQGVASGTTATAVTAGIFNITIGLVDTPISVKANSSLQDIADSINNSKIGVSASVIKVNDGYKIAINSTKTGLANAASYADTLGGTSLSDLGIVNLGTLNETQQAKDASLTINGVTGVSSASNTITSAILGVTLNISGADALPDTVTTINVTADTSVPQAKIQGFIDQYNSTMSFIETKMSYDSATKTAGDLFGDQTLQGMQEHLRNMVSGSFGTNGKYSILSSIGITTSSANFGKDASLTLDSAKFAAAMTDDPDSIANMFGAPAGGVTPSKDAVSGQGVANILENYLHPMLMFGGSFANRQSGYTTQIADYKTRITDFEAKATTYQATQKAKFAALETALSAITAQGTSLTSMLKSLDAQTTTK